MARVLLTGATGLLGRPVLDALVAQGDEIRVLAPPDTVEQVGHRDRVDVLAGGLEDDAAVREAASGAAVVYHLAGVLPGADAAAMVRVNVDGTRRLLDACAGSARRFVFTSSVAVYRPAPWPFMWPIREDSPQQAHGNEQLEQYGQSKIDAEAAVRTWQEEHGGEYVILRPPVVYGPGAPFVERLIEQVMEQPRAAMAHGSRLGVMQWLHARDLAEAALLAGTRPAASNRAFNVAGAELITVTRLRSLIHGILAGRPWGAPPEPSGHYALRFDISSAQELLGFAPRVRLLDGLAEMLDEARPPAPARAPALRPRRRRPVPERGLAAGRLP